MKRACIIAMVSLILLSSTAYAKTELIFSRNNKYGGIIKDIRYSAQDDNYREGVSRILVTYDNNGIKREIIVFKQESTPIDMDGIKRRFSLRKEQEKMNIFWYIEKQPREDFTE